jgi:tartrate-resistant acid phosphatase type 5
MKPILKRNLIVIFISLLAFQNSYGQKNSSKTIDNLKIEDKSFNILVIGDWGRNGEHNQKEVALSLKKTAEKVYPEFIISTGDNFYCCGVASTLDPQWNSSFENIYTGHSLQIEWFPVLGNHDYKGDPQAEIDYSKVSRRWNLPARYHTFVKSTKDKKTIRFIFIDTSPYVKKYHKGGYADLAKQDTARQTRWLDSLLANGKEDLKIVIGHHPVYSTGKKHGNTPELIELFEPKFKKYGVDIYFAGHEHDLQHQKPEGKTDYFVSGSGSEVRPTGKEAYTKFSESTPGFALFSIMGETYTIHYIDQLGKVIYSYSSKF